MLTLAIDLVFVGIDHLGWCCALRWHTHEFDGAGIQLIVMIEPTEVLGGHMVQRAVLSCRDTAVVSRITVTRGSSACALREASRYSQTSGSVEPSSLTMSCQFGPSDHHTREAFLEEAHGRVVHRNDHRDRCGLSDDFRGLIVTQLATPCTPCRRCVPTTCASRSA